MVTVAHVFIIFSIFLSFVFLAVSIWRFIMAFLTSQVKMHEELLFLALILAVISASIQISYGLYTLIKKSKMDENQSKSKGHPKFWTWFSIYTASLLLSLASFSMSDLYEMGYRKPTPEYYTPKHHLCFIFYSLFHWTFALALVFTGVVVKKGKFVDYLNCINSEIEIEIEIGTEMLTIETIKEVDTSAGEQTLDLDLDLENPDSGDAMTTPKNSAITTATDGAAVAAQNEESVLDTTSQLPATVSSRTVEKIYAARIQMTAKNPSKTADPRTGKFCRESRERNSNSSEHLLLCYSIFFGLFVLISACKLLLTYFEYKSVVKASKTGDDTPVSVILSRLEIKWWIYPVGIFSGALQTTYAIFVLLFLNGWAQWPIWILIHLISSVCSVLLFLEYHAEEDEDSMESLQYFDAREYFFPSTLLLNLIYSSVGTLLYSFLVCRQRQMFIHTCMAQGKSSELFLKAEKEEESEDEDDESEHQITLMDMSTEQQRINSKKIDQFGNGGKNGAVIVTATTAPSGFDRCLDDPWSWKTRMMAGLGLFSFIILVLFLYLYFAMEYTEYQEGALEEHNRLRELHHKTNVLELNRGLNSLAHQCAHFYLDKGPSSGLEPQCPLVGVKIGENRGGGTGLKDKSEHHKKDIILQMIHTMYSEIKDYTWPRNGTSKFPAGNFTQIVWRETTELGVGIAFSRTAYKIVFLYKPAGNVPSSYAKNVQSLIKPRS